MPGCERMFARMSSLLSDNLSFPPFLVFFPLLVLVCFHRFLIYHSSCPICVLTRGRKRENVPIQWMDGWMDGRIDGLMDGWMDGWMDG